MTRQSVLVHEFVEFIPGELRDGTLYVCIGLATVVHRCCCGCGNEVVTPLSPTDWKLTFDGETISLYPSIGNWGFKCQSHYWIRNNSVRWARQWSHSQVEVVRAADRCLKERHLSAPGTAPYPVAEGEKPDLVTHDRSDKGFWQKLKKKLSSL
jgi:hypothetical protein